MVLICPHFLRSQKYPHPIKPFSMEVRNLKEYKVFVVNTIIKGKKKQNIHLLEVSLFLVHQSIPHNVIANFLFILANLQAD